MTPLFRCIPGEFCHPYKMFQPERTINATKSRPHSPRHDASWRYAHDNYYWLRDDTRSQPEVLDYLNKKIVTVIG